jgi:hypothetical protein
MIKLKPDLLANLDSVDGLRTALQQAIELEHSTIPTYLYTAYSLKGGYGGVNGAIYGLIMSVVYEEMLHMGLACNILNAIGGSPEINQPGFIPSYPGPLPGGVETGLIVPLAPLSADQIKNIFMGIEEPENPWDFPATNTALEPEYITIGGFYGAIKTQIYLAGDSIFTGAQANQVNLQTWFSYAPAAVTNAATAMAAIDLIVDQGEGTATSPDDAEKDLAHYYRFAEIYYGNKLIPNPNPPPNPSPNQMYMYGGDALALDPTGVQPLVRNPKSSNYPPGSQARIECDKFNAIYMGLLNSLHTVFNGGDPSLKLLTHAINTTMPALTAQAQVVTAIPFGNGTYAGPSFEYQCVTT